MKVIVDMNLSPRWAAALRREGFSARHWSELGKGDASDFEIMAFAREESSVVVTHDMDFSAILAATDARGPSVVQIRASDTDPALFASRVAAALHQVATELEHGALITIDPRRTRLRILPLRSRG